MRVIRSVDALRKNQRNDVAIHDLRLCWRVEGDIVRWAERGARKRGIRHPSPYEVELRNEKRVSIAVSTHLYRTVEKTQWR